MKWIKCVCPLEALTNCVAASLVQIWQCVPTSPTSHFRGTASWMVGPLLPYDSTNSTFYWISIPPLLLCSYDFGSCTLCNLRGKRKTKSTTPRAALFLKEKRRAALGGIRTHDTQASAIATQLVGVLVVIHNTAQRQTSTTVLYNHVQHLSNPGFCGGRGEVTALCLQILLPSCIMHV